MLSHLFISQKCHSLNKATPLTGAARCGGRGTAPSPPTHCSPLSHPAPDPRCSSLLTSSSKKYALLRGRKAGAGRTCSWKRGAKRESSFQSWSRESSSPDIRLRIALLGHNVKHVTLNSKVILHKEPQVKDFSVLRAVPVTIVENVEKKQQWNTELLVSNVI